MNLTIDQCIGITSALNQIKNANNLSFSFAWKLDDIINELKTHVERGQIEQLKLLHEYGTELSEQPGNFTISPDRRMDYLQAVEPVMNHIVDVKIMKFELNQFKREKIIIPSQVNISFLRLIIDQSK